MKLDYTVGDHRYSQFLPTALAVCAIARRAPLKPNCRLPAVPEDGGVIKSRTVTVEPDGTKRVIP